MKAVSAVLVALLLFLFVWAFVGFLILMLAYFSVKAGAGEEVFFGFNFLLAWIIGPFVGAAVAMYASITTFRRVAPETIFVGFNSVWGSVVAISLIYSLQSIIAGRHFGDLVLFIAQSAACFMGARAGRSFAANLGPRKAE